LYFRQDIGARLEKSNKEIKDIFKTRGYSYWEEEIEESQKSKG
jgi:hypothetical protein